MSISVPAILADDQGLFRPIGRPSAQDALGDAIDDEGIMVEPIGIEPMTS